LAKIDATQANEIAEKFEVGGFPTMKWFLDGEVQPMAMEERSSQGIVKWCKKQSGDPAPVSHPNMPKGRSRLL
jgi:protein disulfide-isomerase A1